VPELAEYPYVQTITTRWKDNDVYGHVNNVEYYSYFDTVINTYLIREGSLDIHRGQVIGLCAESHCTFLAAVEFPESIEAALRVGHLGRRRAVDQHRQEREVVRLDAVCGRVQLGGGKWGEGCPASRDDAHGLEELRRLSRLVDEACRAGHTRQQPE